MQRFSDNEIQDYLEGVFAGDVNALEDYLQNTEEGSRRWQSFQAMFDMLAEAPIPSVNFTIENKVMAALDARDNKKSFNWNIILWIFTGVCIAGALTASFVFIKQLSFFAQLGANGLTPLVIIVVIVLTVAVHAVDWQRQLRRYKALT